MAEAPKSDVVEQATEKEEAPKDKEPENISKPEAEAAKDDKVDDKDNNKQSEIENAAKDDKVDDKVDNKEDNKEDNTENNTDFSGTWVLKSSSKSIDEYYKSEGWGYMMRKMAPMIPIKQIIKQVGNEMTVNIIVGPGGKFANETSTAIIGSGKETQYKDKDGLCASVSTWNKDKTQIISDIYRVDDKKRTYTSVRALSLMTDKKMIITTTNSLEKELVQNYEKVEQT